MLQNKLHVFCCPYFKLEIEHDEICKPLLIKEETERIEWFCSFLLNPSILG